MTGAGVDVGIGFVLRGLTGGGCCFSCTTGFLLRVEIGGGSFFLSVSGVLLRGEMGGGSFFLATTGVLLRGEMNLWCLLVVCCVVSLFVSSHFSFSLCLCRTVVC